MKLVYRNVDDAFPLELRGWQAKIGADIKVPQGGQGGIRADYASKSEGLLYSLDEVNNSLMMKFRAAYVAYQSDPCSNTEMLERQVNGLLAEHHKMIVIKTQAQAIVELARLNPDSDQIIEAYRDMIRQIGDWPIAPVVSAEIAESREIARKWIGGGDAS